jgi:hypothetical protein
VLLVVCGCASQESKVTHVPSEYPEKRLKKLKLLAQKLYSEEEKAQQTGRGELSENGMDYISVMKDNARNDPDPQVRAEAVNILADSLVFRDRSFFLETLNDPSWRCKYESLRALRKKKTPLAVEPLLTLLENTDHLLLRIEAIHILRELHAEEAIPFLYKTVVNLLERNRSGTAAWLALKELSGEDFSSSNFVSWRKWYEHAYLPSEGADAVQSEGTPSGGSADK